MEVVWEHLDTAKDLIVWVMEFLIAVALNIEERINIVMKDPIQYALHHAHHLIPFQINQRMLLVNYKI